jgi:signal transduction histidine kinase
LDVDADLLLKQLPSSCLVLAPDMTICAVTADYLKDTLTSEREILGRYIFDVFTDNPNNPEATGVNNLSASLERVRVNRARHVMGVQRYDIRSPKGDFEERYWLPINGPVLDQDNQLLWIVHRVEDITDYVRLKMSLNDRERQVEIIKEDIRRMEAETYNATLQLQSELAAAMEANDVKTQFLAAASHDLRQPIQAANLYADRLTKFDLPQQARVDVDRLQGSLAILDHLLSNLLDFSRIASGKVAPEIRAFWIQDLLTKLADEFRPMAMASGLGFKLCPCPYVVRSDPLLLEQILRNLIGNAIKYTARGGITISCGKSGKNVKLSVCDTGSGIPPNQTESIFEDYLQLGNPARFKGVGLGLAIVARTAKSLGHRVTVYSRLQRGSIFSVYVPEVDT